MAAMRHNRTRRRGRSRFGFLLKVLCVLTVLVALTVGATVFFRVEQVVVSGNSRYTQEDVVAATGIQLGDNLYRMNKFQINQEVRQALPYVNELNIVRKLPNTILITVTEWDAVAQILPTAEVITEVDEETGEEISVETAGEAWLISVGGKLLEKAPADSRAIEVSGLTALIPRAGTPLAVSQEEQPKLDGLLGLLSALESGSLMDRVTWVRVEGTHIVMDYAGRFEAKLPLNGDFPYHLSVVETVIPQIDDKHGPQSTGSMDLTQKDYQLVYSPD